MMSGERRSAFHLYPCSACRDVVSLEIALGEPPGSPPCGLCGAPLDLSREREIRVVRMNGLALAGHPCPRCGGASLGFTESGRFL